MVAETERLDLSIIVGVNDDAILVATLPSPIVVEWRMRDARAIIMARMSWSGNKRVRPIEGPFLFWCITICD